MWVGSEEGFILQSVDPGDFIKQTCAERIYSGKIVSRTRLFIRWHEEPLQTETSSLQ